MDNQELAEKVMHWQWRDWDRHGGNWWYDQDNNVTRYGSGSMLYPGSAFKPLQNLDQAFELIRYLDDEYNIEYMIESNRQLDTVTYHCVIVDYWGAEEYRSDWLNSLPEAICDAAEQFAEEYDLQ